MNIKSLIKSFLTAIQASLFSSDDISVILIVSTGRTGTESVASLFQTLFPRHVMSVHEPKPDLLALSVKARKLNWSMRDLVRKLKLARTSYMQDCRRAGLKFYIESNNNLAFLLPPLRLVFKNVKIIYFTRHPETFLISEMNKRHGQNKFLIFGNDDHRERITPLILQDGNENQWKSFTRAQKIMWYWLTCNKTILETSSGFDVFQVKFEDFFDSKKTHKIVREIIQFAGLPTPPDYSAIETVLAKKSNSSKHNDFEGIHKLSDIEKKYYNEIIISFMRKLGYTGDQLT